MQKKPNSRKDEIELAKSIFDEIVEETESEDWNKPKNKKNLKLKRKPKKQSQVQKIKI